MSISPISFVNSSLSLIILVISSIAVINGSLIAFFYLKGFKNLKMTMKQVLNKSFKESRKLRILSEDQTLNNLGFISFVQKLIKPKLFKVWSSDNILK